MWRLNQQICLVAYDGRNSQVGDISNVHTGISIPFNLIQVVIQLLMMLANQIFFRFIVFTCAKIKPGLESRLKASYKHSFSHDDAYAQLSQDIHICG